MRLSKLSWLILAIGILIIGAVVLYVLYQQQNDEQATLNTSLDAATAALPPLVSQSASLVSQLEQLEAELAAARADLAAAEAALPDDIQSSEYGDLLFDIADNLSLFVREFTATTPSRIILDSIVYETTTITMEVTNDLPDILQFITQIEVTLDFNTTTIDSVNIKDLEDTSGDLEHLKLVEITLIAYVGDL